MADTLKDIPEFFEQDIGESIDARTDALGTFRELGPPDLVHITKGNPKSITSQVGSYHYISGVDASSSASVAAYLYSLTYSVDESSSWFTKSHSWRIRSGIYCCFNSFSRVDVRVEIKIPGGVESYYVDARGQRHETNADIWQETYLSGLLRTILYSDDSYYRLAGYRKLDPQLDLLAESRFLDAIERFFWRGWQLGSTSEVQVATVTQNHLTEALMKYVRQTDRYGPVIELLRRLRVRDPEVGALLAECYLGLDEETKAVKVLYNDLKLAPVSYALVHTQVDFLRDKGCYDQALKLAKYAVNTTPSEFLTWEKLTEVYIDLEDYQNALSTLNSCPMYSYSQRDLHHMPAPLKTHLPIKPEILTSGMIEEDPDESELEVNPSHKQLTAPTLKGTFARAYSLLTKITQRINWDDLLQFRAKVFVMEEEYRQHKSVGFEKPPEAARDENQTFGHKRLCERWLDNLFMMLYEDLRVYVYWRAEMKHYRDQNMVYRKTGMEWELLGDLAMRLWHEQEAKEAYEHCLDYKFSAKAWLRLLKIYTEEKDVPKALLAAVKLTVYHDRWYHEITCPSEIGYHLLKLSKDVGLDKMENTLISMKLPASTQKLMMRYRFTN